MASEMNFAQITNTITFAYEEAESSPMQANTNLPAHINCHLSARVFQTGTQTEKVSVLWQASLVFISNPKRV